jgi:hypothetical protein
MHTRIVRFIFGTTIASAIAVLLFARTLPVDAAGVVTDCTSQAGLVTAMSNGSGLINFNCNGTNDPATIIITQDGGLVVSLFDSYTIDGGNKITLSGANTVRIFLVSSGAALTLTNIILTNGNAAGSTGPRDHPQQPELLCGGRDRDRGWDDDRAEQSDREQSIGLRGRH